MADYDIVRKSRARAAAKAQREAEQQTRQAEMDAESAERVDRFRNGPMMRACRLLHRSCGRARCACAGR
jgi:hypothetical protein